MRHHLVGRPAKGEADHAVSVEETVLDDLPGLFHRMKTPEIRGEHQPELLTAERVGVVLGIAGIAASHGSDNAGAVIGKSLAGMDPFDCHLHVDSAFSSRTL